MSKVSYCNNDNFYFELALSSQQQSGDSERQNLGSVVHWSQLTLALLPSGPGQMQSNIIHNTIQLQLHLHLLISQFQNIEVQISSNQPI